MKRLALLAILMCIFLTACSMPLAENAVKRSAQFFYMDTVMDFLSVYGENAQPAIDACAQKLLRLDTLFATQNENGEIYALNKTGRAHLSSDVSELLLLSQQLYAETDGAFDITVYPLMQLWGFGTEQPHVPTQAELADCLKLVGSDRLSLVEGGTHAVLQPGTGVDLGAIAKGYAADRVTAILQEHGVASAIVSLGGTIVALGEKPDGSPWRVGIQSPDGGSGTVGMLCVRDCKVATAGGYRRFFEENGNYYHHILDPRTGQSAHAGLLSVTIVSQNGALADALSTALYVMGPQAGIDFWRGRDDFEFVFVCDDGAVWVSEGLQAQFEPVGSFEVINR